MRNKSEAASNPRPGDLDKFLLNVVPEPNSGCWLWLGATTTAGYGFLRRPGSRKRIGAHRWILQQVRPTSGVGLLACHHCDNPICVNPDHLFWGTCKDNSMDCSRKGRIWRGGAQTPAGRLMTCCKRGHLFTPENTKITSAGWRNCRTCLKLMAKAAAEQKPNFCEKHEMRYGYYCLACDRERVRERYWDLRSATYLGGADENQG